VLSELIKPAPAPQVLRWVDDQDTTELVIAAITAAELPAGAEAICRQHDAILATRNINDFEAVKLMVVNPWSEPED
jgi:predicted nucleic acid-binding protein